MFTHIDHMDRHSLMRSAPHGTQVYPTGEWIFDVQQSYVELTSLSIFAQRVSMRFGIRSGSKALVDQTGQLQQVDVSLITASVESGSLRRDDRLRGREFLHTSQHATIDFSGRASSNLVGGVLTAKEMRTAVALEAKNATLQEDGTLAFALGGCVERKQLGLSSPATFMVGHEICLQMRGIAHRA